MVMTEWKKTGDDPTAAYATARKQAELYSGGVLGGLELASHRYLVVVTKQQFTPPQDISQEAVQARQYCHRTRSAFGRRKKRAK
jgi:hypothetical protein